MISRCLLALTLVPAAPAVPAEDKPLDAERLFDTSRLLEVRIEMLEKDWRALCAQDRSFADALGREPPQSPFTYFKASVVIDGVRIDGVGIRKKGFLGSLDDERPSLRITLHEDKERQPIGGVDRLTLNNNKQDEALASQYLAYQIFARAGAPAPRCNLARVTVNDAYLGIYSNVESIGTPFLERHFGDGSGRLYEGTVADFFPGRLDRFEVKGSVGEGAREPLERVTEILASDGDLPVERLEGRVDIDAFLRYWVVESLIGFWDGYTNNQNNYLIYEKPASRKLYWIPWGADAAFSAPPPVPFLPRGPDSVRAHSVLSNRLYHNDAMRERYRKTLLDVLETVWQEERLLAELDRLEKIAGDHLHESQRSFEAKLEGTRQFIKGRRARVMADLEKWPVEVAAKPRVPVYTREVGSATGSFSTTWRKDSPEDPYGNGQARLELVLYDEIVKFKQLGVSAEPRQRSPGEPRGKERPPAIVFTGERESDGTKLTLGVVTSRDLFRPDSSAPVPVQGLLLLARGGFRFISGTATFDKAGMEPGAPVEGRVALKVLEIHQPRVGRRRSL